MKELYKVYWPDGNVFSVALPYEEAEALRKTCERCWCPGFYLKKE